MKDIKLFGAQADEILWKRVCLSLVDRNPPSLPAFHVLSEDLRSMTSLFNQQAGDICLAWDTRSRRDVTRNTPPQVDTYTYKNKRTCARTPLVRMERNMLSLLAFFQPFIVSPAKPLLFCSSGTFIVFHALESSPHRTFSFLRRSVWMSLCKPSLGKRVCAFLLRSFRRTNVKTSLRSVDVESNTGTRSCYNGSVLTALEETATWKRHEN